MHSIRESNKSARLAEKQESKASQIDRVKANLPLPDDPPCSAPDFNSMDDRTTDVGSGGVNVKLGTESENGLFRACDGGERSEG